MANNSTSATVPRFLATLSNSAAVSKTARAAYKASSNIEHAVELKGKLILVVGGMDNNVDPACTLDLKDALKAARKKFRCSVKANKAHGALEGLDYRDEEACQFFRKYLGGPMGRERDDKRTGSVGERAKWAGGLSLDCGLRSKFGLLRVTGRSGISGLSRRLRAIRTADF
jgi:hypothetical protein